MRHSGRVMERPRLRDGSHRSRLRRHTLVTIGSLAVSSTRLTVSDPNLARCTCLIRHRSTEMRISAGGLVRLISGFRVASVKISNWRLVSGRPSSAWLRSSARRPTNGSRCLNSQNARRCRRAGSRGWSTSYAAEPSSRESPGIGDRRMLFVTLTTEGIRSRERADPERFAGHSPDNLRSHDRRRSEIRRRRARPTR
jgi:hypothetical protein